MPRRKSDSTRRVYCWLRLTCSHLVIYRACVRTVWLCSILQSQVHQDNPNYPTAFRDLWESSDQAANITHQHSVHAESHAILNGPPQKSHLDKSLAIVSADVAVCGSLSMLLFALSKKIPGHSTPADLPSCRNTRGRYQREKMIRERHIKCHIPKFAYPYPIPMVITLADINEQGKRLQWRFPH